MTDISLLYFVLLFLGGIWAAALNAVAGGGTFFTFPLLMFMGLPPTLANTTNKIAIFVGSFASIGGYWSEIKTHRDKMLSLSLIGSTGSIAGSLILLSIPASTFEALVPWLMLAATLVFASGKRIIGWLERHLPAHQKISLAGKVAGWIGQFLVGIYGGFFGAGIGIFLMALYELMGIRNLHSMNGLKVLVATAINFVSIITFVIAGKLVWEAGIPLAIGAVIGGYYGAVFTKRLPQLWVRYLIIAYGLGVCAYFFLK